MLVAWLRECASALGGIRIQTATSVLTFLVALVLGAVSGTGTAAASTLTGDVEMYASCTVSGGHPCAIVSPGTTTGTLAHSSLLVQVPGAVAVLTWGQPRHGTVSSSAVDEETIFRYHPDPSFWSVGIDLVPLRVQMDSGKPRHVTLLLIVGSPPLVWADAGFEDDFGQEGLTVGGTEWLGRVPEAAIHGDYGLSVGSGTEDGWVTATVTPGVDWSLPYLGDGHQGSKTQVGICPPGDSGNDLFDLPIDGEISILAGGAGNETAWEVKMRRTLATGYEILTTFDQGASAMDVGNWHALAGVPQILEIDWWRFLDDSQRGLQVRLDGKLIGSVLQPPAIQGFFGWIRAGRWNTPASGAPAIDLDGFKVSWGLRAQALAPLQVENFEDGNLDRWSTWTLGPADLIAPTGVDEGSGSTMLAVDVGAPAFLVDHEVADDRFGIRFLVDTREVQLPVGERILLFDGREASNLRHLAIWMKTGTDGITRIYAGSRTSDAADAWFWTDHIPVSTTDVTAVEMQWRRSFDASPTGRIVLTVDGTESIAPLGLDTADRVLTKYFVGARVVPVGASGKLYFDDIATWVPSTP